MPPIGMSAVQCEQLKARCLEQFEQEDMSKKSVSSRFVDSASFRSIMHDIDTFIFDADGVLWLGEDAIPGSASFVEYLLRHDKQIIVLTNNATKSRAVYAKKLEKLGFPAQIASKESVVNPAAVVADTLHRAGLREQNKKVYLIGGQGVKDELDELAIDYFGCGFDPVDSQAAAHEAAFLYRLDLEEDAARVGAVVVGYEKYFNYLKLMKAANYLQEESCLFVATNEDETCPGPNPGTLIPDAGPLVAAVRTAAGRAPLVVGKPNRPAFDYIQRRWRVDPARTIMIGDRTNTDVKFGRDHGLRTMLVLSGCHQLADIAENAEQRRFDMVPEFFAKNLGSLVPARH